MAVVTPNTSQIDPKTGLAISPEQSEILKRANSLASQAQRLSPLDERFNIAGQSMSMSEDELSTFTDRDVNLQVDGANEEVRAERQGLGEKLANGAIKFGGKTLTATAGGILGPVVGIPSAIANGSFNSFFDNDYQRWLDSMNESMDKNLPNYKTKEEQEAGFLKSLGSANFWADDFLGAMSFTAGAILTEMAYAPLAGAIGEAAGVRLMNQLQKSARAKETLKALDAAETFNKIGKATNVTRSLITGAGYEAGVEARQFKTQAKEQAISDFQLTNGRPPSEEELVEIDSQINNTANAVFTTNMSIVGLSNFLQFPKIFGAGTKAEIGLFGKSGLIGEAGAFKGAYTEAKGLTKGLYTAAKMAERPLEEGLFEEGLQSVTQNAAQNYISSLYSPEGLMNQKDIFESLGDAFAETYGTKEGWKEIGLGMLVGGMGSPSFRYNKAEGIGSAWAGGIYDSYKELSNTQKNIDALATKNNNFNISQIAEQAKQNRAIFEASKRYDAAIEKGDVFEAKTAENDILFAMTAARHEAGLGGNFKEELTRHIDSLTEEQFADTYDYANKTKKELQERKDEVKKEAIKKVDQHIKAIEKAKQLIPSEDSQDETRKNIQLGLAYTITGVEDLDAREEELSDYLSSKVNGVITDDLKSAASIKLLTKEQDEKFTAYKKELKKLNNLKDALDRAVAFSPSEKDEESYKKKQIETSDKIKEQEKVLKEQEKEFKDIKKIITQSQKAKYDYDNVSNFRDAITKIMKVNELKEKAKLANPLDKEEIDAAFNDLSKIAARRQDLIDTYNKLFTKAGQAKVDSMTKKMLKDLQAFGIHIMNPEANLKAQREMELSNIGLTISKTGKVITKEEAAEETEDNIQDNIDELTDKVDDETIKLFTEVSELLKAKPITSKEFEEFIKKLNVYVTALERDRKKYTQDDTQLIYEELLTNIQKRIIEAKEQLSNLKKEEKEGANTPFAATVNNPSDVFNLFQGFVSPEVQSMVSALTAEELKGRVSIKIEDLPEEFKGKKLLEKIPGSGVFLKNGHTKKEGKGIYVYLDGQRIGGLFDPRRFVHKDGKEMIISENNPAIIKLINPDFVTPDGQLTDTGKKFVRYIKALKNFYETTLDVKDELTPEETEQLLKFEVIAERFVKYADEGIPYSERPKISDEFSDPKWEVEIPGVFKGLIVFNRLKLDDQYRAGEYIFIRKDGVWQKPDDSLKFQIQEYINEQAKAKAVTIGWGNMSQYGLLIKTNESGKNLRVIDVGVPTTSIEDKKGFMANLNAQLADLVARINDPNYDKAAVGGLVLDEKGNEYFVPLLVGKDKKEGALQTKLKLSTYKDGNVNIQLDIYYNGQWKTISMRKLFGKDITVETFSKLTYEDIVKQLGNNLRWNQENEKGILHNTGISKLDVSLSENAIRRMPDLEGNEPLFENMVVNSNVVFGKHNIQVRPKDTDSPKYDITNPAPKQTQTSTSTGITTKQKDALNNALKDTANVVEMISVYDEISKLKGLDPDTIQKLITLSNKIKDFRKSLGFTQGEEEEEAPKDNSLQDLQNEYKTIRDEVDEISTKISLNIHEKAEEVKLIELKTKAEILRKQILEEKSKKPKDDDSVVFSTSMTPTSDPIEYHKALFTLKRILPDFITVKDVDVLLENIQNKGITWGAFMDKVVYLSRQAGKGTEYHEAFHAVFRTLLTDTEIDKYYDLASKRYGTPTKTQLQEIKVTSSAYINLSNQVLRKLWYEEQMAEDFKKYALGKEAKLKESPNWLRQLFDKILNMIRAISGKREELDILFSNIYSGSFKNTKPKNNIFSFYKKPAFSLLYTNDETLEGVEPISTLSRFKSEKLIHTVAAKLFTEVVEKKGVYSEKDLDGIINNLKQRYTIDNYSEELKRLFKAKDLKAVMQSRKSIIEFQRALEREDNIKIIKDDVQTILKELYGVQLDEDYEESRSEQDTGRNEFEERSMSSVGGMNSLSKKMKQYMNMTMYYTDEFGLGLTPEELNQEKYQVAINGSELYQGLERLLANTNKTHLFEKLYQYKSSNANADAFYNKMVQDIADDISSNFDEVEGMLRDLSNISDDQVQLEQAYKKLSASPAFNSFIIAFNKNKVKYFKVLYDGKTGNIKGINANDQDVDTVQFEKWKNNFISKQLTKVQVDDILNNIRKLMDNYDFTTKKESLNDVIVQIKFEFSKLGIDLSFGFIKYSLISKHLDKITNQELIGFYNVFSDVIPLQDYESLVEGDDKDTFKVLKELNAKSDLGNKDATGESVTAGFFAKNTRDGEEIGDTGAETRLKQLAENNAIFDESVGESTFQNAENKTVFDKVFPSYITQAITMLRENTLTQSDLEDVVSLKEAYRVRGTILSDYQAKVLLQVLVNNPLLKGLSYDSKSGFSEDPEVVNFIFKNMQVFIMDGLKQESLDEDSFAGTQEEGKTYKDLDKRAKALMMLSMFADTTQKFTKKVLDGFNPEGTRLFILGTNEAKSTTIGVNLPVQNFFANGNLTELGLKYFNSTFKQEYERIQKVKNEVRELQRRLLAGESLVNYSHSYHGELDFIRNVQFDDNGNITNYDTLIMPRGLKFFQLAKMPNALVFNKQAVEGKPLPNVDTELNDFAKFQLEDYLNMLSGSDVDILTKKGGESREYTPENITTLKDNEIFVFGSNAEGAHGKGAALLAKQKFGAKQGQAEGLQGQSYAVITKKNWRKEKSSTLEEIGQGLYSLITFADRKENKNKKFLVTKLGSSLAGYSIEEIKSIFANLNEEVGISENIILPKEYEVRSSIKGVNTTYEAKQLPAYYTKESTKEIDENKIGQYFFNHYFNTTAFNYLLHGDYAMNYKDSVDVVKRNGGLIAFGPDMGLGTSNYAVVEDEDIIIDEINSDNKSVTRTDAQSLGHINWYIDTYLKGMGKYNQAVAPILDRIRLGLDLITPLSKRELAILENNNATLQPRKIVQRDMFTYLKTSLHTITRAQVSYISPEYKDKSKDTLERLIRKYTNEKNYSELDKIFKPLPGKEKLHDLYNQMERQDIGFTIFHSGSKMSNFDVGRHNGTTWELNKLFINNNTLREQVSTDGFKESIVHGTQLMNLIWSEQDMKAVAAFMSKSAKVSKLVDAYKGLLKYRVKTGSIELKDTIFESAPDGKLTEAKWKELLTSFHESLEKSGSDPYLLELFVEREDGTGSPKYNPNFAFVAAKYEAMYLAYVSKYTLAQKTAGRKYTLVSDYGNEVLRNENGSVVSVREFRANPDKYKGYSTSRLKHRVSDGKGGFYSEAIVSEKAAKVHNLKAGDIIPNELAEQFGIRIPTQDDHSMVNLKVVDVIPGYYGNAITVPVEIIKLSGADFDIDAMYARIYSTFNNQFKNNGLHTHGDYLKADSIESAQEMAYDEYLNRISRKKEVKEAFEQLKETDVDYYPIEDALDSLYDELSKSKTEDKTFRDSVKQEIDDIKTSYKSDEEFNSLLERGTYKGEINKHVLDLKLKTAKLVAKIAGGIYNEDKNELLEHISNIKQLYKEANRRLQYEAIKLAGFADTKTKFLDAQSLNKDGILKSNRDLINKNLKAYNNGDVDEITPLSKEEADNLLLTIERGLLHNSSEAKKKIGLTPSSMDNFKTLRKSFAKMGLPSSDATTGINSPLDILLSANANDVGKKGIGPAALFNVIFQKLNESKVTLSEEFKSKLLGGLDKFDTFGNFVNKDGLRINDVISSIISAMTDNAKERYAAAFNLTPDTLGPALTMVGLGIPFETVMVFMKQPIVVEMANWFTLAESPVKPKITRKGEEGKADYQALVTKDPEAILEQAIKVLGLTEVEVKEQFNLVELGGASDLVQGLLKGNNKESSLTDDRYKQLQMLVGYMFLEYKKASTNLISLSQVSALTKGLPSTWTETKRLDDALKNLGFSIVTDKLDGPNSYKLQEEKIDEENKIFEGLKDVLSKEDVLTNLQTYGFLRDSAKFYFILQTPVAKYIGEQIKKNFREGHFDYEDNKIALDRAIISGLTMIAYKNFLSKKDGKPFKFNFNLLFSDSPNTWGKLPLLMQKALSTERYRRNPLLNYLKTKQITFEKGGIFKGRTLNKIEGNTRSEKNYDYLEALMDGYRQIAIDAYNNEDLKDGLTSKEIKTLNGWLVQYIVAKDSLLFLRGTYIKNLTPGVLHNASISLDDIQSLFSGTSDKSFSDVFGMPRQDVIAEIEELYSRGEETAWRGLRGSKTDLSILRAESAKVANNTKEYPFFVDKNSIKIDIFATLSKSSSEEEKKKIVGKNMDILTRHEIAQQIEIGAKSRLAFPTFIMLKEDKKNIYFKLKSFSTTIAGKSVLLDNKGNILEGSNKGKNIEDVNFMAWKNIFTPEGIVATNLEYERTLGKIGHRAVKPWAFSVEQWDDLHRSNLERQLLEEFNPEELPEVGFQEEAEENQDLMSKIKSQMEQSDEAKLLAKLKAQYEAAKAKGEGPKMDDGGIQLSLVSQGLDTSKEQAEAILNKLSTRFGIKWVWDETLDEVKGMYYNGVVHINPNKFKSDTLFHEFAHPFITAVRRINPELYEAFKQETIKEGKSLLRIKTMSGYQKLFGNDEEAYIEEAMVTLIGRYATEINTKKSEGLSSGIKDILNKIFKEFIRLIKLVSTGEDITVRKLAGMSLKELAATMVFGDNKIILPTAFTAREATNRIILQYNLKNGNISKEDYNKVKKAVDTYNAGVGHISLYMAKRTSGYAILTNGLNLKELEKSEIIKRKCN